VTFQYSNHFGNQGKFFLQRTCSCLANFFRKRTCSCLVRKGLSLINFISYADTKVKGNSNCPKICRNPFKYYEIICSSNYMLKSAIWD